MTGNCIEILGLNYESLFTNFSVAFEDKKFITIAGPNNSGKTTLIRIISNQIVTPSSVLIYGIRKEDYRVTDLSNIVRTVIPKEFEFTQETVEDELSYQLPLDMPLAEKKKIIKQISHQLKITKELTEPVDKISEESLICLQIALALINNPKILIIDDLSPYFEQKKLTEIVKNLKKINQERKITIILITSNLELCLESDYTYIINNSEIVVEGTPIDVIQKDNVVNKAGLNIPFMVDLSVKLRDYDLIKELELDMDRMVNTLWK